MRRFFRRVLHLAAILLFAGCTTGGVTVERSTLDRIDRRTAEMQTRYEEFNKRLYELDRARQADRNEAFEQRRSLNDQVQRLGDMVAHMMANLRVYLNIPEAPAEPPPSTFAPLPNARPMTRVP